MNCKSKNIKFTEISDGLYKSIVNDIVYILQYHDNGSVAYFELSSNGIVFKQYIMRSNDPQIQLWGNINDILLDTTDIILKDVEAYKNKTKI